VNTDVQKLLSPRVVKHCVPLYNDGYYKHAAREAMVQVELALKEKSSVKDRKYGMQLVSNLLGKGASVKLRVPLGDDLQPHAETLFKGAFAYY